MERSKYDEEKDEWILPFAKKKVLKEAGATAAASGASMLPDIFSKGFQAENSRSDAAFASKPTGVSQSIINNKRATSSRDASRQSNLQPTTNKPAIVPLLTLPGNILTAASIAPTGDYANKGSATGGVESSRRPPQQNNVSVSSRPQSSVDIQDHSRSTADPKKRKTSRPPKDKQEKESGSSLDQYSAYCSSRASADPEAGSGVSAGPVVEWGFVEAVSNDRGIGYSGPELEYSDDDDFESAEDANTNNRHNSGLNVAPYPPPYGTSSQQGGNKGRKKKKKSSSSGKVADSSYEKPSTVTSLPPI